MPELLERLGRYRIGILLDSSAEAARPGLER
jgi:hypothetical protein